MGDGGGLAVEEPVAVGGGGDHVGGGGGVGRVSCPAHYGVESVKKIRKVFGKGYHQHLRSNAKR